MGEKGLGKVAAVAYHGLYQQFTKKLSGSMM